MDKAKSPQLVTLVNYFTKEYFYSLLYVKGAEEAVFLLGSATQKYQLIIITTENMIDYLAKQKLLRKIKLVSTKLESEPENILIISYHSKKYEGKENNIDIVHLYSDFIPKSIDNLYPSLQDLELFDDFIEKLKEEEQAAKELDKKNIIQDNSQFFKLSKEKLTQEKTKLKSGDATLFTKSFFSQNTITKALLIITLFGILALQFFLKIPAGSVTATKTVAFGALYAPFTFGFNGGWRFFTYIFISEGLFSFVLIALTFYFYSRMSESFYGAIRYFIILIVGTLLSGLVIIQLFPDSVFYGLAIPMWILIGSTGTFIVAKWRNISKSIKIRYFLYFVLILFLFSILGDFGGRIEAGLIAFIIGIVLGSAVQFKTINIKETWKKSINPIIALTLLFLVAIVLPFTVKRSYPLTSPLLNQSVMVTYEKYNLINKSARETFIKMNEKHYSISRTNSNCLWNLGILYTNKPVLSTDEQTLIDQSINELNSAFIQINEKVANQITSSLDLIISRINQTAETTLYDAANDLKTAYTNYIVSYTKELLDVFSDKYENVRNENKKLVATPDTEFRKERLGRIYNSVMSWQNILVNKNTPLISLRLEQFKDKPQVQQQYMVRFAYQELNTVINNDISNVDFTSFKSVFNTQIGNLSQWCFELAS